MAQVIVMVIVMAVVVGYTLFGAKKRLKGHEAKSSDARAGELAQRMGLEVVEGDPMTNLMYARAIAGKVDGTMPETKVRLVGAPGDRETEVYYYERVEHDRGFTSTTVTSWLSASVSVKVRAPFPEFEVIVRKFGPYAVEFTPKLAAPPQQFADPALEAFFVVKAHDARVVPVIAESLRGLSTWGWVHIHGADDKLTFHCTRMTATYLGIADQIQLALDEMAIALETAAAAHRAG